jgi:hypothetical protein
MAKRALALRLLFDTSAGGLLGGALEAYKRRTSRLSLALRRRGKALEGIS